MDTLYRKGRYQEIISKLNALDSRTGNIADQDRYAVLQEEVNKIIESLRNRGDQSNAQIHYILLLIPLAVVLILHTIYVGGYYFNLIVLLLALLAVVLARYRMNQVIRLTQENVPSSDIVGDSRTFIFTKIDYLERAMGIKKSRLLLISLLYMIFFPIFLVRLHELAFGAMAFDSDQISFLIAYLVGAGLWYFYYNRAFEVYDEIEQSLDFIKAHIEARKG